MFSDSPDSFVCLVNRIRILLSATAPNLDGRELSLWLWIFYLCPNMTRLLNSVLLAPLICICHPITFHFKIQWEYLK